MVLLLGITPHWLRDTVEKLLSVNTDGCRIFKMQVKTQPWETARLDTLQCSGWELASLGCNSFVTDRLQNVLWSHQVYILSTLFGNETE